MSAHFGNSGRLLDNDAGWQGLVQQGPDAKTPWEAAMVSEGVVQQSFTNSRLSELNDPSYAGKLIGDTLTELRNVPYLANANRKNLIHAYMHMTARLQKADLTINFKALNWFSTPNNYETYTQMYERAIQTDGTMVLNNKDRMNPALARVNADDEVTIPQAWRQLQQQPVAYRGLTPHPDQRGRLVTQMSPGQLVGVHYNMDDMDLGQEFTASNFQFNPKTKQIFSALNYGWRPYGSNTQYGHSHIVLDAKFKANAIYFAGDTFMVHSTTEQISYNTIAALFLKADDHLKRELTKSCLLDGALKDTDRADEMIEAHLFEKLEFSGNITELHISSKDCLLDNKKKPIAWTADQKCAVFDNANAFAKKHGAKFFWD
jgi:hypothetical protein